MISWSEVVERISDELSLPFQTLEKTDDEIIDYCKRVCVKKFSRYFPETWRLTIDTADTDIHVPDRTSEFYLVDPEDRTLLTVKGVYPTVGDDLFLGHPYRGTYSYESIPDHLLSTFKANTLRQFSNYDYGFELIYPNRLSIRPSFTGQATIEYERTHDPELTTLPPDLEDDFIELCISMTFMLIGRIRKKFQTIQTPFGEIQLNADDIYQEGKERYDTLIQRFQDMHLPNIIFDRG